MAECQKRLDEARAVGVFLCVYCHRRPLDGKLLDCLHATCSHCAASCVSEGAVLCPACQCSTSVLSGVSALPVHHVASQQRRESCEQAETGSTETCEECDSDECNPAAGHCKTCNVFLCDFHVANHRRSRRTKQHSVDSISAMEDGDAKAEDGGRSPQSLCVRHGEEMSEYCKTCGRPVCPRCVAFGHSKHEVCGLSEDVVKTAVDRLEAAARSSQPGCFVSAELGELVEREDAWRAAVATSMEAVSEEIECFFEKLIEELRKREAELLEEVSCKHREMAAPSEAVSGEAKEALSSFGWAHIVALETQRLLTNMEKMEEEGVITKCVCALKGKADKLLVKEAHCRSIAVFSQTTAKGHNSPGRIIQIEFRDTKAVREGEGDVRLTCSLSCSPAPVGEDGDDASQNELMLLKRKMEELEFSFAHPSTASQAVVAPSSSGSGHAAILGRATDIRFRFVSSDELEMLCMLQSASNEELPPSCDVIISHQGRVIQHVDAGANAPAGFAFHAPSCPQSVKLSMGNKKV